MNSAPLPTGFGAVTSSSEPSCRARAAAPSTVTAETSRPFRSRLNRLSRSVAVAVISAVASSSLAARGVIASFSL